MKNLAFTLILYTCIFEIPQAGEPIQTFDLPEGGKLQITQAVRSDSIDLQTDRPILPGGHFNHNRSVSYTHSYSFDDLTTHSQNSQWTSSQFKTHHPCLILVFRLFDADGNTVSASHIRLHDKWAEISYMETGTFQKIVTDREIDQPLWHLKMTDLPTSKQLTCLGPLTANQLDGRSWVWTPAYPRTQKSVEFTLVRKDLPDFAFTVSNSAHLKEPLPWQADPLPKTITGKGWQVTGSEWSHRGEDWQNWRHIPKLTTSKRQSRNGFKLSAWKIEDNLGNVGNFPTFSILSEATLLRYSYQITRTPNYRWNLKDLTKIAEVQFTDIPGDIKKGVVKKNSINLQSIEFKPNPEEERSSLIHLRGDLISGTKTIPNEISLTFVPDGEKMSQGNAKVGKSGKASVIGLGNKLAKVPLLNSKIISYHYIHSVGNVKAKTGQKMHICIIPKTYPETIQFTTPAKHLQQ